MLNQEFSANNFLKLVNHNDPIRWDLGKTKNEYLLSLQEVSARLANHGFSFSKFKLYQRGNNRIVVPSTIQDEFAIRKLNDSIKRVFGVRQLDRTEIIKQIATLLTEKSTLSIVRLDVKSFYESIRKEVVLDKVLKSHAPSYDSKRILKALFESASLKDSNGLPRGLSISSSLSEIYMQDFDARSRAIPGVYFYARYVDDIIVLCNSDPKLVVSRLTECLPDGLVFGRHPEKDRIITLAMDFDSSPVQERFSYLGYKFMIAPKTRKLSVSISDNKIRRLKTRMCLAFEDFVKNKDELLLEKRIRFLSSNYHLVSKRDSRKNIKSGIYYNYKVCAEANDKIDDLRDLDCFLNKLVYSERGSIGKRLSPLMTASLRGRLSRISFLKGYSEKLTIKVDASDAKAIRACWGHV